MIRSLLPAKPARAGRLASSPPSSRTRRRSKAAAVAQHELTARAERLASREIAFIPDRSGSLCPTAGNLDEVLALVAGMSATGESPAPLLKAAEEARLFTAMNLLKCRANALRLSIVLECPDAALLAEIEQLLEAARAVRNCLIQANLRLVVSIARRFVDQNGALDELISDGNLTLMHAVEKFDAGRGFRFSTYATHAIQRCFYARLRRRGRTLKTAQTADDFLDQVANPEEPDTDQEDRARMARLHYLLTERLDERERIVLQARFGIGEENGPQTLRSIAARLNLSKERIRQLQIRALQTLQEFAASS